MIERPTDGKSAMVDHELATATLQSTVSERCIGILESRARVRATCTLFNIRANLNNHPTTNLELCVVVDTWPINASYMHACNAACMYLAMTCLCIHYMYRLQT